MDNQGKFLEKVWILNFNMYFCTPKIKGQQHGFNKVCRTGVFKN